MQHLYTALDALIEKHKDNEYIMGRLEVYMTQLIPNALQAETQTHKKREQRKQILNEGRQKFTERFMCKNNYYYCPNNELFLNYNGTHFIGQNEDNIHHQILSKITNEQGLVPWKHKINNEIIRLIKTRSPTPGYARISDDTVRTEYNHSQVVPLAILSEIFFDFLRRQHTRQNRTKFNLYHLSAG